MNVRKLFAILAVMSGASASASSTSAQQSNYPFVEFSGFQSSKTRVEVEEELIQSQARGDYVVGSREYDAPDANFKSSRTRAEVLAELEQSKADGTYAQQDFDTQYPQNLHYGSSVNRLARAGR